jgi:RNA recognition motif-containing protein
VKKLFVGNLSANRTPDDLRILFQTYGQVEHVEIMTDVDTRYSRGFALISMTNDSEAARAVDGLHGTTVWGNALKVEEARPRPNPRNPARTP